MIQWFGRGDIIPRAPPPPKKKEILVRETARKTEKVELAPVGRKDLYILAFGVHNNEQVNVCAQFLALHLRKVMLNAANICLFGIIHTKCKYIYMSFRMTEWSVFLLGEDLGDST